MTRTRPSEGGGLNPRDKELAETPILFGVSFEEGGVYYGVCLNHFMMTMVPAAEELDSAIAAMIDAQIETSERLGVHPFAHLPIAPAEYWKLWLRLTEKGVRLKTLQPPPGKQRPAVQIAEELRAAA
jgi:hypothetical protein